jgi:hypothetical protein
MRQPLLVALALVAACGDSTDPAPPAPLAATIFDLQSQTVAAGRQVEVTAYITSISATGSRVWLSDALTTAAWMGIEVFRGNAPAALGLSVGDRVQVTGTFREFGAGTGLTVSQLSEPEFELVTPASGATVPLTGLDLANITLDPVPGASANGEPYEGVLIQAANLEVTATAPFTLSDGTTSFAASNLVIALNDPVGTCYATVTGIWNYDVNTDEWIVVPTVGGLVAGGTC